MWGGALKAANGTYQQGAARLAAASEQSDLKVVLVGGRDKGVLMGRCWYEWQGCGTREAVVTMVSVVAAGKNSNKSTTSTVIPARVYC